MPVANHEPTGLKVLFCVNRCDTTHFPDGGVRYGYTTMSNGGNFAMLEVFVAPRRGSRFRRSFASRARCQRPEQR